MESVNCGQANVKVTEIKTEIKRGDSNTVKPPDLPFQWLWEANVEVSHAKVFFLLLLRVQISVFQVFTKVELILKIINASHKDDFW